MSNLFFSCFVLCFNLFCFVFLPLLIPPLLFLKKKRDILTPVLPGTFSLLFSFSSPPSFFFILFIYLFIFVVSQTFVEDKNKLELQSPPHPTPVARRATGHGRARRIHRRACHWFLYSTEVYGVVHRCVVRCGAVRVVGGRTLALSSRYAIKGELSIIFINTVFLCAFSSAVSVRYPFAALYPHPTLPTGQSRRTLLKRERETEETLNMTSATSPMTYTRTSSLEREPPSRAVSNKPSPKSSPRDNREAANTAQSALAALVEIKNKRKSAGQKGQKQQRSPRGGDATSGGRRRSGDGGGGSARLVLLPAVEQRRPSPPSRPHHSPIQNLHPYDTSEYSSQQQQRLSTSSSPAQSPTVSPRTAEGGRQRQAEGAPAAAEAEAERERERERRMRELVEVAATGATSSGRANWPEGGGGKGKGKGRDRATPRRTSPSASIASSCHTDGSGNESGLPQVMWVSRASGPPPRPGEVVQVGNGNAATTITITGMKTTTLTTKGYDAHGEVRPRSLHHPSGTASASPGRQENSPRETAAPPTSSEGSLKQPLREVHPHRSSGSSAAGPSTASTAGPSTAKASSARTAAPPPASTGPQSGRRKSTNPSEAPVVVKRKPSVVAETNRERRDRKIRELREEEERMQREREALDHELRQLKLRREAEERKEKEELEARRQQQEQQQKGVIGGGGVLPALQPRRSPSPSPREAGRRVSTSSDDSYERFKRERAKALQQQQDTATHKTPAPPAGSGGRASAVEQLDNHREHAESPPLFDLEHQGRRRRSPSNSSTISTLDRHSPYVIRKGTAHQGSSQASERRTTQESTRSLDKKRSAAGGAQKKRRGSYASRTYHHTKTRQQMQEDFDRRSREHHLKFLRLCGRLTKRTKHSDSKNVTMNFSLSRTFNGTVDGTLGNNGVPASQQPSGPNDSCNNTFNPTSGPSAGRGSNGGGINYNMNPTGEEEDVSNLANALKDLPISEDTIGNTNREEEVLYAKNILPLVEAAAKDEDGDPMVFGLGSIGIVTRERQRHQEQLLQAGPQGVQYEDDDDGKPTSVFDRLRKREKPTAISMAVVREKQKLLERNNYHFTSNAQGVVEEPTDAEIMASGQQRAFTMSEFLTLQRLVKAGHPLQVALDGMKRLAKENDREREREAMEAAAAEAEFDTARHLPALDTSRPTTGTPGLNNTMNSAGPRAGSPNVGRSPSSRGGRLPEMHHPTGLSPPSSGNGRHVTVNTAGNTVIPSPGSSPQKPLLTPIGAKKQPLPAPAPHDKSAVKSSTQRPDSSGRPISSSGGQPGCSARRPASAPKKKLPRPPPPPPPPGGVMDTFGYFPTHRVQPLYYHQLEGSATSTPGHTPTSTRGQPHSSSSSLTNASLPGSTPRGGRGGGTKAPPSDPNASIRSSQRGGFKPRNAPRVGSNASNNSLLSGSFRGGTMSARDNVHRHLKHKTATQSAGRAETSSRENSSVVASLIPQNSGRGGGRGKHEDGG
eukprot:gene6962-4928_t